MGRGGERKAEDVLHALFHALLVLHGFAPEHIFALLKTYRCENPEMF